MRKIIFIILFVTVSTYVSAESISLTTYYPSPVAVYDRTRLVPRATLGSPCEIGTVYMDTSYQLLYCSDNGSGVGVWGPFSSLWKQVEGVNTDRIYPIGIDSNPDLYVGIGTETPQFPLHVANQGEIILDNQRYDWNGFARILYIERGGSYRYHLTLGECNSENVLRLQEWSPNWVTSWAFNADGDLGIGTESPLARFHVADGSIFSPGTFGTSPTISISGAGDRFIWYPRKGAFRAGGVSSTAWNDENIGSYSTALGYNTRADGDNGSFAAGKYAKANGNSSVALGDGVTANTDYSVSFGHDAIATTGSYNLSIGQESSAEDDYATSIGYKTVASGHMSTAIGKEADAIGDTTYAIGREVTSSSSCNSFAVGYKSIASGSYSVAGSESSRATGSYSCALGYSNTASGTYSIAMGKRSDVSGYCSTVLGRGLSVTGDYSLAIGLDNLEGTSTVLAQDNTMSILGGVGVGINTLTPTEALEVNGNIAATGNIVGGSINNLSSSKYKKNIESLSLENALKSVESLKPVKYNFISDDDSDIHLGFIAEDVPDLVATEERKGVSSMDIASTLIKVLKFQQELLIKQKDIIEEQQKQIDSLIEKVSNL